MSRYVALSAAYDRARARAAQCDRELQACRCDPAKANHKRNALRRVQSEVNWFKHELARLETAEG